MRPPERRSTECCKESISAHLEAGFQKRRIVGCCHAAASTLWGVWDRPLSCYGSLQFRSCRSSSISTTKSFPPQDPERIRKQSRRSDHIHEEQVHFECALCATFFQSTPTQLERRDPVNIVCLLRVSKPPVDQCYVWQTPTTMGDARIGDTVLVTSVNAHGIVRYADTTDFATGHWIGVELDTPTGKNDGSVAGKRYFNCRPGHGMFVKPSNLSIVARAQTIVRKSSNGAAKRSSRPSSGVGGDTTKKRQSVAQTSSTGSRLSMRVRHLNLIHFRVADQDSLPPNPQPSLQDLLQLQRVPAHA